MTNEASNNAPHYSDDESSKQVVRRLQLVRAGSSQFGIFANEIATIVPWREPTPLPNAPKSVLGVVSVQGRMLTVLDLASLPVGETPRRDAAGNSPEAPRQLVALRGDEQLALAVDEVGDAIEIAAGEIAGGDFEKKREAVDKIILGVLQRDGVEIKILNPSDLFPTAIQGRERRRRRF